MRIYYTLLLLCLFSTSKASLLDISLSDTQYVAIMYQLDNATTIDTFVHSKSTDTNTASFSDDDYKTLYNLLKPKTQYSTFDSAYTNCLQLSQSFESAASFQSITNLLKIAKVNDAKYFTNNVQVFIQNIIFNAFADYNNTAFLSKQENIDKLKGKYINKFIELKLEEESIKEALFFITKNSKYNLFPNHHIE